MKIDELGKLEWDSTNRYNGFNAYKSQIKNLYQLENKKKQKVKR